MIFRDPLLLITLLEEEVSYLILNGVKILQSWHLSHHQEIIRRHIYKLQIQKLEMFILYIKKMLILIMSQVLDLKIGKCFLILMNLFGTLKKITGDISICMILIQKN